MNWTDRKQSTLQVKHICENFCECFGKNLLDFILAHEDIKTMYILQTKLKNVGVLKLFTEKSHKA